MFFYFGRKKIADRVAKDFENANFINVQTRKISPNLHLASKSLVSMLASLSMVEMVRCLEPKTLELLNRKVLSYRIRAPSWSTVLEYHLSVSL